MPLAVCLQSLTARKKAFVLSKLRYKTLQVEMKSRWSVSKIIDAVAEQQIPRLLVKGRRT